MFTIQVDIWPHGRHQNKFAAIKIACCNDGTGTRDRGNYDCWLIPESMHDSDDASVLAYVMEHRDAPNARIRRFPRRHDQAHLASLTCAVLEGLGLNEVAVTSERDAS